MFEIFAFNAKGKCVRNIQANDRIFWLSSGHAVLYDVQTKEVVHACLSYAKPDSHLRQVSEQLPQGLWISEFERRSWARHSWFNDMLDSFQIKVDTTKVSRHSLMCS